MDNVTSFGRSDDVSVRTETSTYAPRVQVVSVKLISVISCFYYFTDHLSLTPQVSLSCRVTAGNQRLEPMRTWYAHQSVIDGWTVSADDGDE